MLRELSEDLSRTKKIQSEMNNTLFDIKKNLQRKNSRMDEAENQINDLEHEETKNSHWNNNKKKEFKKMRVV